MFREKAIAALVVALLSSTAATVLWLREHPASPFARRAAAWPVVGSWVRALVDGAPAAPAAPRTSAIAPPLASDAPPPAWLYEPAAAAWLAGKPIPGATRVVAAPAVEVVTPPRPPRGRPGDPPPLGSAAEPVLPVAAHPADPERLARARACFPRPVEARELAGYALLSDVEDPALVERLRRLAAGLEARYRERLGVAPVGRPAETIVLFAREADYRAYQESETRIAGLAIAAGHAGYGMVALFAGGRRDESIGATLTHELVHLLDRRAIGPGLPAWLDEGLAEDFAEAPLDESGAPLPGGFSGAPARSGDRVEVQGGLAALESLGRALEAPGAPALVTLARLDWESFVAPERGALHYAEAFLFVRYLLDADPALATGFRGFLAAVARGESVEPENLERHLGRTLPELEAPWRAWVAAERSRRLGFLRALEAARLPTLESDREGAAARPPV